MINNRIIPVLLIKNGYLYKTVNFKNPTYIGDPVNAVKIFNEKEVDELIVLDIEASQKENEPDYDIIFNIASECFMPLTYGGGINSIEKAKMIFDIGIEKVVINSSLQNLDLISEITNRYGSQSVVASIDYKSNYFQTKIIPYSYSGTKKSNSDFSSIIKQSINAGAGEVMIQSIDKDGTMSGYDIETLKKVKKEVNVPVIICGGAGKYNDFYDAKVNGASGLAAGSLFVYKGVHKAILINYPDQGLVNNILEGNI